MSLPLSLSPSSLPPCLCTTLSLCLSLSLFSLSSPLICAVSTSLFSHFLSDHSVLPVTVSFPMFRLHRSTSHSQDAVARHRSSRLRETSSRRRTALHSTLELRKGMLSTWTYQLACGSHDSTFQSTHFCIICLIIHAHI